MSRTAHYRAVAALTVVVVALTLFAALPGRGLATALAATPARVAAVSPGVAAAAGRDYASDTFADPWDYSNADDLLVDPGPAMRAAGLRVGSGVAAAHFTGNGYISPVWGGYGGPLFLGRDGGKPGNALNTALYRTVAFQAYSSRSVSAALMWFNCARALVAGSCEGATPFTLKAGWNTYVLTPGASGLGLPLAWGGMVNGLRLAVSPGAAGSDFKLDWFRLVKPLSGTQLSWFNPAGGASQVVWDADANPANNATGATGWGVVSAVAGTSGTADLSVLPAGNYWVGLSSEPRSAWALVSLPAPLPRFITPNAVGDRDYARTIMRNPWDFNSASDVYKVGNANRVSYAGGQLAATNTSNDPYVMLRLGAGGINTRVFRNLTVTSAYSGLFNLRNVAGGGTMARVQWGRSDRARGQTDDILTYSGTRVVTVDMGLPTAQLVEPGTRSAAFVSPARVTSLRWDPNEDRGARRWYLKDVQLRSDFATTGTFPLTWTDAAYQGGGTATVVADTNRSGCNGAPVAAGQSVSPGRNVTVWNTRGVAPGRYWLCLTITRGTAVTSAYATGVLIVGANPRSGTPLRRPPSGLGPCPAGSTRFPVGLSTRARLSSQFTLTCTTTGRTGPRLGCVSRRECPGRTSRWVTRVRGRTRGSPVRCSWSALVSTRSASTPSMWAPGRTGSLAAAW